MNVKRAGDVRRATRAVHEPPLHDPVRRLYTGLRQLKRPARCWRAGAVDWSFSNIDDKPAEKDVIKIRC
jgi:hypothetical protein